eukprot:gene2919-3836_t
MCSHPLRWVVKCAHSQTEECLPGPNVGQRERLYCPEGRGDSDVQHDWPQRPGLFHERIGCGADGCRRADGSRFWGSCLIAPLRVAEDPLLPGCAGESEPAYCLIVRDISDKRERHEALH